MIRFGLLFIPISSGGGDDDDDLLTEMVINGRTSSRRQNDSQNRITLHCCVCVRSADSRDRIRCSQVENFAETKQKKNDKKEKKREKKRSENELNAKRRINVENNDECDVSAD